MRESNILHLSLGYSLLNERKISFSCYDFFPSVLGVSFLSAKLLFNVVFINNLVDILCKIREYALPQSAFVII